jgi:hypothetical protein
VAEDKAGQHKGVAETLKARDTRPKLKTTTVVHQEVDYFDLDAFVKRVTGRDWEFAAAQECGNDTEHTFSVSSGHWSKALHDEHPDWTYEQCKAPGVDPYDQAKIDAFLAGDRSSYPDPQTMLDWLAANGHILPGNYLVKVSW